MPRRSGISSRTVALRIVPKAASPIDPPSVRKNMIVAVATPRSWKSTAFWVAIDVVVNTAAIAEADGDHRRDEPGVRRRAGDVADGEQPARGAHAVPTTGNGL